MLEQSHIPQQQVYNHLMLFLNLLYIDCNMSNIVFVLSIVKLECGEVNFMSYKGKPLLTNPCAMLASLSGKSSYILPHAYIRIPCFPVT